MIQLRRIELLNWDLQANQLLVLQPGVNLLTGENGSGKTSILDAIKAALGASRGRGLGGDRTVDDYLRKRGAVKAMVRLVLGNPADEGTRKRPFDVLAAGFEQDLVGAGALFEADEDEGYRKTYFLADGDTSPLAPGDRRKPLRWKTRKDYVERLDRLGLNESFRTLLCTPQGDIAALCKRSPGDLFSMLFDFIGGRQVLDEWERLKADYEALVRSRDEHRARVGQAQKRLVEQQRRLRVHEQFRAKVIEQRVLRLAVPLAELDELQQRREELDEGRKRSKQRSAQEQQAREAQLVALAELELEAGRLIEEKGTQEVEAADVQARWKAVTARLGIVQAKWQQLDELRAEAEGIPQADAAALRERAAECRRALARLETRGEALSQSVSALEEERRQIEERGALQPPVEAQRFADVLGKEKLPFHLLMDLLEPVNADVDFLSGDFTSDDSVNSARFEGRCLRSQGKPWDLMAWGFYHKDDSLFNTKTAVQLQQEAAVVLALGGGFQAYFTQNRDASINSWQMDVMAQVAKFCRVRQEFCHKTQPVPQIALLYSREALYRKMKTVFRLPWEYPMLPFKGVLNGLLDSQYSVEVLVEHHLTGRMREYPLIVIPEWDYLDEDFKAELLAYVNQGGNLLLVGTKATALFEKQLGVTFEGQEAKKLQWVEHNGRLASINTLHQSTKLSESAKPFGKIFASNGFKGDSVHAASINEYGKGKIAGVYFDFGQQYREARTVVAREFLNSLVRQLFPEPVVEVTGSHNVDVTVNRIDGKLAINLVNTSGPHSDSAVHVFDEIPAVGPLEITICYPEKPKKVMLEPDGKKMKYKYSDGKVHTVVPQLDIHSVIVIE